VDLGAGDDEALDLDRQLGKRAQRIEHGRGQDGAHHADNGGEGDCHPQ